MNIHTAKVGDKDAEGNVCVGYGFDGVPLWSGNDPDTGWGKADNDKLTLIADPKAQLKGKQ